MPNSIKSYFCCALTLLAIAHFDAKAEDSKLALGVRANAELFVPSDFVTVVFVINYYDRTSLAECQAEAGATTQEVIAGLVNFGIKTSNIYLGEALMPLCNPGFGQGSRPLFEVIQEINIDLMDVSELESVLIKLADFSEVKLRTLKPRAFEAEKHFDRAIQLAIDEASKQAAEVGMGMGMAVGKILKVEKSVALAAYPVERIEMGTGHVFEPVNTDLFNESLNQVEIRAEVGVTFSLEDVQNSPSIQTP